MFKIINEKIMHCTTERISVLCFLRTTNYENHRWQWVIFNIVGTKQHFFTFCMRLWEEVKVMSKNATAYLIPINHVVRKHALCLRACVMFDSHMRSRWLFFFSLYLTWELFSGMFSMFMSFRGEKFFWWFRAFCIQSFE